MESTALTPEATASRGYLVNVIETTMRSGIVRVRARSDEEACDTARRAFERMGTASVATRTDTAVVNSRADTDPAVPDHCLHHRALRSGDRVEVTHVSETAGFFCRVAVTRRLWEYLVRADLNSGHEALEARLFDVLNVAHYAAYYGPARGDTFSFSAHVRLHESTTSLAMKGRFGVCGGEQWLCISLPHELVAWD